MAGFSGLKRNALRMHQPELFRIPEPVEGLPFLVRQRQPFDRLRDED